MSSSPFDILPTEVIQKIFLSCLQAQNHLTFVPSKENDVVQFEISQVCSRWRSIALATPQLWDDFILTNDEDDRAESALRLASLWFDRARNSLIALKVWTYLPHNSPSVHELHRLISSHRFKSLAGSLLLYWIPLHHKSYEESFTFLDSLSLDIPDEFRTGHPLSEYLKAEDHCQLPSLLYLHINVYSIWNLRWRDALHMIPWHQLSRLTLHNVIRLSTVMEIMWECKALRECNLLWTICYPHDTAVLLPTCPLPNLCNLQLSSPSPIAHLARVLTFFTVTLTSLHAALSVGVYFPFTPETDRLLSQLDAPFRQLQEFTFSDGSDVYNTFDAGMLLAHLPSLRRFSLEGNVSLDHNTAIRISTGELGRYIDTISFKFCRYDVRRLLEMIEKRQDNAKCDKGGNLTSFILVAFGCPVAFYDIYKERAQRLECQHNVRIEMEPSSIKMDDDGSAEGIEG